MAASGARGSRKGARRPHPKPAAPSRAPKRTGAAAPTTLPAAPAGPLRLGAIEGATPGKWVDVWKQRMPRNPIELVPLTLDDQRAALVEASVDAALVRLPIGRDGLRLIPLYDEIPVVVCAADSHLTAADELTVGDLAGEVVIVLRSPLVSVAAPGSLAPAFAPPTTVEEAVAVVAAGVGVVIVPMSLARAHHRKDTAYRSLKDGPTSTVALAWRPDADGTTPPLVETFIGIVRGRTANSSR